MVVAKYKFQTEEAVEKAMRKINSDVGYGSADTPWGEKTLSIYERCPDIGKAKKICENLGGVRI